MFRVEMLSAKEGDSLWVTYGDSNTSRHVIIDAGRKDTYRELVERIATLEGPAELFVMTHIDDDHIFGAVPLFGDRRVNRQKFRDIWYNGYTHLESTKARRPQKDTLGPINGEIFAALLLKGKYSWNEAFDKGGTVVVPATGPLPAMRLADDMNLTLLSPTWDSLTALKAFWEKELDEFHPGDADAALEIFADRRPLQPDVLGGFLDVEDLIERPYASDTKAPNGSSIAFLAEHDGRAVLFTGDAHPPVLEESIGRLLKDRGQSILKIDALKVSHHGSKNNTSQNLLKLLNCRNFLISTDGSRHSHPDGEAIARILYRNRQYSEPTHLYFNYKSKQTQMWEDGELMDEWNYRVHYPPQGCTIDL